MRPVLAACCFAAALCSRSPGFAAPAQNDPGERSYRDLPFSYPRGHAIRLDLYVPRCNAPAPLVVWFHGGAWSFGGKRFHFLVRRLPHYGIAVASVQYRLTWSAHWPAQGEDCLAAVHWLRANGRAFGVETGRMGLSGESAGGQLAALAALSEGRQRIRAVVLLYPPTDLTRLSLRYRGLGALSPISQFAGLSSTTRERSLRESSPVNFVTSNAPPFLIFHGDRDIVVPVEQSRELHSRLRLAGVESHLVIQHGRPHGFSLTESDLNLVAAFFKARL